MKKTRQGKAGLPAVKPQQTLLHFFQRQAEKSSSVERVSCPGCDLQVPKNRINGHLDRDCKSRCPKGAASKNRRLRKAPDKEKARKFAVLSDSEDDSQDFFASDAKENESPWNSDSEEADVFCISPSMVETQLSENEEDVQTGGDGRPVTSSYLSPDGEKERDPPRKRPEKVVEIEMSKNRLTNLASDWDSAQTPRKDEECRRVNAPQEISSVKLFSPWTKSGKEVKTMLLDDWDTPGATPRKKAPPGNETTLRSPGLTRRTDSESENDFEKALPLAEPKLLSPRKRVDCAPREKGRAVLGNESEMQEDSDFENVTVVLRKSPKNSIKSLSPKCAGQGEMLSSPGRKLRNRLDDNFENSNTTHRTPIKHSSNKLKPVSPRLFDFMKGRNEDRVKDLSPDCRDERESVPSALRSPGASSSSNMSDYAESLILFNRTQSLGDPSSPTSPSTLPGNVDADESLNPVRQLFMASPTKSEVAPINEDVSPRVRINKFSNLAEPSSSQEDVFESLLTSSQGRKTSRSPWKVKQGLRRTGLLQNSSSYLSATITKKNKQTTPSPLSSLSSSPAKSFSGEPSSSTNAEEGSWEKYDRAVFRQTKGYYLENFLRILDTVLSEPQDIKLLNDEDLEVVSTFRGLSLSAQKLYVRLFQRKIKWNKVSKIEYRDICDQEDMELYVNELGYANFLHQESEMDSLKEVLQILSCGELQGLCKQMRIPATGRKDNVIRSLLKFARQQTSIVSAMSKGAAGKSLILERAKESLGHCCMVKKNVRQVFIRILMLYGLPRYDDDEEGGQQSQLTTLLMVNMGKMKFPQFEIIRNHSIFRTRDDLIRYETCSQILADVQECIEGKMWEAALKHCALAKEVYKDLQKDKVLIDHDRSLPRFLRHYTSASLLMYILTLSVECCQKIKKYQKAVNQLMELLEQDTYLLDYHGRWYDRLALNLEMHLKKPALAVEAISKALRDPEVRKGHRLSLSMRAERMAASPRYKALAPIIAEMALMAPREPPKVIIEGRTIHSDIPGQKRLFIRQDSDRHAGEGEVTVCSVEELALRHYKEQGYSEGLHREGTTVNTLFALCFWNALYAPVSDVFRSPHQAAPLDLDDLNFYSARKELIDKRLAEVRDWSEAEAEAELEHMWKEHAGELSLVAWDLFRNCDHAKGLLTSMGIPVLAAICERLAKDHRFTRSGFPDLIVWNPVTKRCCIVEVKGPNDKLSTKQILWLDYLLANGVSCEVCHVEAKKMTRAPPRRILPKRASEKKESPKKSDDGKTLEEPKRRMTRQKKEDPESDIFVEEIKSQSSRLRGKGKKITDNDIVSEVTKSKRKNSDSNEKGEKARKEDTSAPEKKQRRKRNEDFEEQALNKKRKIKRK